MLSYIRTGCAVCPGRALILACSSFLRQKVLFIRLLRPRYALGTTFSEAVGLAEVIGGNRDGR